MTDHTLHEAVAVYREAKAIKDNLTRQYKERVAELDGIIDKAKARILAHLNETGHRSITMDDGVRVERVRKVTPRVSDWEAFLGYVRDTGNYELLQRRIAQRNAVDFMRENEVTLPGVNLEEEYLVRITAKKEV